MDGKLTPSELSRAASFLVSVDIILHREPEQSYSLLDCDPTYYTEEICSARAER